MVNSHPSSISLSEAQRLLQMSGQKEFRSLRMRKYISFATMNAQQPWIPAQDWTLQCFIMDRRAHETPSLPEEQMTLKACWRNRSHFL